MDFTKILKGKKILEKWIRESSTELLELINDPIEINSKIYWSSKNEYVDAYFKFTNNESPENLPDIDAQLLAKLGSIRPFIYLTETDVNLANHDSDFVFYNVNNFNFLPTTTIWYESTVHGLIRDNYNSIVQQKNSKIVRVELFSSSMIRNLSDIEVYCFFLHLYEHGIVNKAKILLVDTDSLSDDKRKQLESIDLHLIYHPKEKDGLLFLQGDFLDLLAPNGKVNKSQLDYHYSIFQDPYLLQSSTSIRNIDELINLARHLDKNAMIPDIKKLSPQILKKLDIQENNKYHLTNYKRRQIVEAKEKIESLIIKGTIDKALREFNLVAKHCDKVYQNELKAIMANFSDLKSKQRMGRLDLNTYNIEVNKVIARILDLLLVI